MYYYEYNSPECNKDSPESIEIFVMATIRGIRGSLTTRYKTNIMLYKHPELEIIKDENTFENKKVFSKEKFFYHHSKKHPYI